MPHQTFKFQDNPFRIVCKCGKKFKSLEMYRRHVVKYLEEELGYDISRETKQTDRETWWKPEEFDEGSGFFY